MQIRAILVSTLKSYIVNPKSPCRSLPPPCSRSAPPRRTSACPTPTARPFPSRISSPLPRSWLCRKKELSVELEKPETYAAGGAAMQLNRDLLVVTEEIERITTEWESLAEKVKAGA